MSEQLITVRYQQGVIEGQQLVIDHQKATIAEQAATIERFRAFVSEYNNKSQTVEDFRRFWAAHAAITPADMGEVE